MDEKILMKIKNVAKHEIIVILLVVIAAMLLGISYCLNPDNKMINILQGLATGILSGIVLLIITGIKSKESKWLK